MPPFSYAVPERRNIGFLKLLISTRPIHSTAGTWPCLCRLESDGPSTLDGDEFLGTLTIPMIQRRVSDLPPPTFAHLAPCSFLVHSAISTFQIYCTRNLSGVGLDTVSTSNSLYAPPVSFLSHPLTCHDEQFHSPIAYIFSYINFDFLFFIFCKLDVCVINLCGTLPLPSLERTLLVPVRDHRNTIRKYCSNRKSYSNNNNRMDKNLNRTRGSAGQVDQRKIISAWTTIRLLEFIMSKHIFLPTIGHVVQSKTPEPACARGRSNKVYETVPGTVTVGTDQWTIKELTSEKILTPYAAEVRCHCFHCRGVY